MSDIADDAALAEEMHRAKAIEEARRQISGSPWQTSSAMFCGERDQGCEGCGCGERIPDERRRAIPGVKLCVECQTMKEAGRGR